MKKIISLILIAILCLGVLTSCAQLGGVVDSIKDKLGMGGEQPAEGPSLDDAASFLHKIYKDKKETTRTDFDVVAVVAIDGVKFPVAWTSDNDKVVIRESTKTGYYTVDLPDVNNEEFSYTLTATISNADGETASKSYTFKVPVIDNSGITSTPVEGVAYKLFLLQGNENRRYYALNNTQNNENKFINTTLNPKDGAEFFVEKVDGGYKIFTDVNGVKTYMYAKVTRTEDANTGTVKYSKFIGFNTEEGSVFSYNEKKGGVWTVTVDELVYGVGTYGSYTTISLSDESFFTPDKVGSDQFVMQFMTAEYANTLEEDKLPDSPSDAEGILNQLYALADGEQAIGSFTLTGKITALDNYNNPTIVVEGFENMPVYCYRLTVENKVGDTITVTATTMKNYGGTYEFMNCTLVSGDNQGGNTPETPDTPSDLGIVTSPEVGVAYKFGLFHGNEKANVFFNGQNYNNYAWYLAYAAAGVDVYLETVEGVEGGYRIYFMNGDAKTYIVAFPRDGDTTKGTLKLDTTTPAEYFTFNTEYNTLVYTSTTGEQFYLGSSGTYKSISCSAISYITNADSYVSHLYAAGATGGEGGEVTPPEGGEGDEPVTPPVTDGNEIIFDFGANGTAGTHADGNDIGTSKTYTSGNYSLVITDALKAYDGGFDKAGNSILKLGTGSVAGTITFTVPANVNSVVIYAARYKNYADNNMIVVNGVSYTLTKNSDDGEYEAITVDTTTNKTVTVASTTDATKPRCVVNSIVWVLGEGGSETPDTPVDPQPPVHEHNFVEGKCECGETDPNYVAPEAPAFGVVTPVAGTAYKFGMVQSKAGKTVYLKGGMSGYYMATTEDINAAIDVYLEETTDGYYLYTLNADGSKLYINMVVSGTHVNGAYEAAASTVYTIDADRKSIVATVNDELYHFGTRNDNTYLTVGPCKVSYNGFDCQFYGATGSDTPVEPEQPEHQHTFVEGKCECGETDPDYTPDAPVASGNSADFDAIALPSSKPNGDSSYTGSYTSTNGWVTANSAIQCGGAADINPQFTVIGPDNTHKAVCMNGKTSAPGSITSPTLTGGVSKITINFTKMFTDTELSFTVTVTDIATGTEYTKVISKTLEKNEKYVVYTEEFVLDTAITGDFTIELVNNCPTGQDGNKDRVTILDIIWA